MSNLDECCRFGVLIPSDISLGVVCNRSNACDFFGGARSPGMGSEVPGGGCCSGVSYGYAIQWKLRTYGCAWANHNTGRSRRRLLLRRRLPRRRGRRTDVVWRMGTCYRLLSDGRVVLSGGRLVNRRLGIVRRRSDARRSRLGLRRLGGADIIDRRRRRIWGAVDGTRRLLRRAVGGCRARR